MKNIIKLLVIAMPSVATILAGIITIIVQIQFVKQDKVYLANYRELEYTKVKYLGLSEQEFKIKTYMDVHPYKNRIGNYTANALGAVLLIIGIIGLVATVATIMAE